MNDIEVLAKLKQMYEMSFDLKENTDIFSKNTQIFNELYDMYSSVYNRISKERGSPLSILCNGKVLRISSSIDCDYVDKNGASLSCGDVNYYWYLQPDKSIFTHQKVRNIEERIR